MTWTYENKPIKDLPEGVVGFVYQITNNETGRKYIGKKLAQFKKSRPPLKGRRNKRRYKIESDWKEYFEENKDLIFLGKNFKDIEKAKNENKTAIFFGFQNCSPIEDDINLIEKIYEHGCRFMQLTYNNQSLLASGCYEKNDGGVTKSAITMHGDTGDVRIHGNLTIDGDTVTSNTSTLTVEDNIIELNRNVSSNSGMPNYTGLKVNRGQTSVATEQNLYWVWDETFADDGTTIHGNAGGAWTAFKSGGGQNELSAPTLVDVRANIVHATSTAAQYADLAERYESDCETEVGDVVMLGGHAEVTKCNKELCDQVFGVVSESPAFLMNASAGNNDTHPMIALKGRVLVKLTGKGNAGERIVSAGNGEARVANIDECTTFNPIGRLIKHKYNEETTLTECVIGVK